MYLENVVVDAVEPQQLGRFWESVLASERLTDEPDGFETRVAVDGGPTLDLCLQRVPEAPGEASRLQLTVSGGSKRLIALGARPVAHRRDASRVELTDPEGNAFGVLEDETPSDGGPILRISLDSADPDRDVAFWSWLTGWTAIGPRSVRHPSLRGPVLELVPEPGGKAAVKNRMHLDVRLEESDDADAVAAAIGDRGGRELHPDWGALPWRLYVDPSGNDFCVLPYRA